MGKNINPYIPDLDLYDSFLVEQFNAACTISSSSLYEPLAAVYTRRKHIFNALDTLYGTGFLEPFAFIEYLLYHRTGNKKRLRTIMPVLDIELDRQPCSEYESLILAINYLYMISLSKIILDPMLEFKYTKLWYGCKNHLKEWKPEYNHLAMLAELAPTYTVTSHSSLLGIKAMEKYGRFFEARGMAIQYIYDNKPDASMVPMIIESVLGIHLSTAKKTFDFVAPDTERFGVYGLRLGRNTVSVNYERGKVSVNTDRTIYMCAMANGYELKRLPIPASASCTVKL